MGKKALFLSLCAAIIILSSGCATRVTRLNDGKVVQMPELLEGIKRARVIFVGEAHDDEAHHRAQRKVITLLDEAGVKLAIGLEAFPSGRQDELDRWTSGALDEADLMKLYYENWSVPWEQYRDILMYAQRRGIPVVGLNISRAVIHRVVSEGASNLKPEDMNGLEDVRCDLDDVYKGFIRKALKEHGEHGVPGGADKAFDNYCEAQVVWDRSMAARVVEYLNENPGQTMVALSGSAHAWKRGIPRRVGMEPGMPYIVILPETHYGFYKFYEEDTTLDDADYLWVEP